MPVYSAHCGSCGGAHLELCGSYARQIARLVMSIATTGFMFVALIPVVI